MFYLLIVSFVYLFAATGTANAATYYLDAVNGDDSNPGTQALPWRTLARAYDSSTADPNVEPGDTVYLRSGNYGDFAEGSDTHADWIYYEAEAGETPVFTRIALGSISGQYVKKLSFKGITITAPSTNGVQIRECNDIILDTLTIQGDTAENNSRGIYLWYGQNVTIRDCTIESVGGVNAFEKGIYSRFSHDVTVDNCNISHCDIGISAWGRRWEITDNVLHDLYSDGILIEGVNDTNITGNLIYDIDLRPGSVAHSDGFQIYYTQTGSGHDPNSSDHVYMENITFANNIIHTIERQGIFINPGAYAGSPPDAKNITIENNLVYNTDTGNNGAYAFTSYNNSNQIFRNNVVAGQSSHWRNGSVVNTVSGNLLELGKFWDGVPDPCYMGQNIVWDWWDIEKGATDIETRWDWSDSTKSLWQGLFADYDNGDFRLASDSHALDFCPLDKAPATDLEGKTRIDIEGVGNDGSSYADAGCYEYIPAGDNQPPDISGIPDTLNKSEGQTINNAEIELATDPDGDSLTYTYSELTDSLPYTIGYDQAGTHTLHVDVSDGTTSAGKDITITVTNVNRAPVLAATGNKSVSENDPLTFTVDATDPDGDTITYSVDNLPSGATFASQSLSWTPNNSQVGSYESSFTASDGQLQDSETITITVNAVDTSPPTVTNCSPDADAIQVPLNNLIILHIADEGEGVDANSVTIKVDNNTVYTGNTADYNSEYGRCRRIGTKADYTFIYQSNEAFDFDQTVTVTVNATDLADNTMNEHSYSFKTEMRSFGENKKVDSGLGSPSTGGPATVRDSSGNIWAAWHAGPIGSRDIYVSRLAAGADNFGSSVQLTNDASDQCNAAIALDGNDKLYVVWQDNRRGNWDIYEKTSAVEGNWSPERLVTDSTDNQVNPAIVINGSSSNKAYVVWQDDRASNQDIYIATSSNDFVTKTLFRITSDSSDQVEPAITVDSNNMVYVVWTDGRNGSKDIYGADSYNGPWRNVPIVSKTNNQSSPAIAAEDNGSALHFLWVDDTPGNKDIYYATSNGLPNSPLSGNSIIDDDCGTDQLEPAIAVTGSIGDNLKVFTCWQDQRNAEADLYFAEITSSCRTNVLVSDESTNSDQTEPAIGIDEYGYPYLIWADIRNTNTDICYAGSTFIEPDALASKDVSASLGATVGISPAAISSVDDVSIFVPSGACPYDVKITISKIKNPQAFAMQRLGCYDFGPSGIKFSKPVTVTIPYPPGRISSSNGLTSAYRYEPFRGTVSQKDITGIETIVIFPTLHALRFKTTHFTQFLIGGSNSSGSETTLMSR